MFARIKALIVQLQVRADDRLMADIGLSRAELEAMHLGLDRARLQAAVHAFPTGKALPVLFRA